MKIQAFLDDQGDRFTLTVNGKNFYRLPFKYDMEYEEDIPSIIDRKDKIRGKFRLARKNDPQLITLEYPLPWCPIRFAEDLQSKLKDQPITFINFGWAFLPSSKAVYTEMLETLMTFIDPKEGLNKLAF